MWQVSTEMKHPASVFVLACAVAGLAVGETIAVGIMLPMIARHHIAMAYWRYLARCVLWFAMAAVLAGFALWRSTNLSELRQARKIGRKREQQ